MVKELLKEHERRKSVKYSCPRFDGSMCGITGLVSETSLLDQEAHSFPQIFYPSNLLRKIT